MSWSEWYQRITFEGEWMERYPAGAVPSEYQTFRVIDEEWDLESEPPRRTIKVLEFVS